MIEVFEENHKHGQSDILLEEHHEDIESFCNRFQTYVYALVKLFQEHGNPFEDAELTTVNIRSILLPEECDMSSVVIGKRLFDESFGNRLVLRKVSVYKSRKNNLP